MSDQLRATTFKGVATGLRAYAARQEARAPGRMDHITGPALAAASCADRAADAYATGDREAAKAARNEYAELVAKHGLGGLV